MSSKTASKAQRNHICETAMVGVRSTKRVEYLFQLTSLHTHFLQKLDWDIPHGMWAYAAMGKIST